VGIKHDFAREYFSNNQSDPIPLSKNLIFGSEDDDLQPP